LLNVLKSSRSRTCLPENVCKFFFHCYTYACVASVFMVVGVRCAVCVEWRFSCDETHRITTKTALLFIYYFLFIQINSYAFGETNFSDVKKNEDPDETKQNGKRKVFVVFCGSLFCRSGIGILRKGEVIS
ncbi:hypothetical protein T11_3707, partial [Trichinella zimbabwensis]